MDRIEMVVDELFLNRETRPAMFVLGVPDLVNYSCALVARHQAELRGLELSQLSNRPRGFRRELALEFGIGSLGECLAGCLEPCVMTPFK